MTFQYLPEIETAEFKVPAAIRNDVVTQAKFSLEMGGPKYALSNWGIKLRETAASALWYAPEAKSLLDEIVYKMVREVEQDQDSERMFPNGKVRKPRPSELYREHHVALRVASQMTAAFSWRALDLLQSFQLESSLPFNDLTDNPGIDGYTHLPITEECNLEDIIPEQHEINGDPLLALFETAAKLWDWEDAQEQKGKIELVKLLSQWDRYAQNRNPYDDPKMNELFYRANREGIGDLYDPEEDVYEEHNTAIPMHMEISQELNLSYEANQAISELKGLIIETAEKVEEAKTIISKNDKKFWKMFWPQLKSQLLFDVGNSVRHHAQWLDNYECAAMIIAVESRFDLPINSAEYLFDRELLWPKALQLAEQAENKDHLLRACSQALSFKKNPGKGLGKKDQKLYARFSKEIWKIIARCQEIDMLVNLFGDDIAEILLESGGLYIEETSEELIHKIGDKFMDDILSRYPEYAQDRKDTRAFQEGFIRGVMEGLPITNADYTCIDNAHDFWREHISPTGYVAYRQAISKGKDHNTAMKAFWTAARSAGDVKDDVIRVEPNGIILRAKSPKVGQVAEPRKVNYGLATHIFRNGEIDLEGNKLTRMISILREKRWGTQLLQTLTS